MIDLTTIVDKDKIYSPSELAKMFRVSNQSIFNWIKYGLEATKIPLINEFKYQILGLDVIKYISKFNE